MTNLAVTPDNANNATVKPNQIAGFWRRLFAFFLDIIVLGLVGACLGYFLYDYFASIGGWGRLIGFPIALTYFGVMNSRLRSGQTLGMKIMKIRVILRNGESLSAVTSFCRASIFCVPYFLNGAPFDVELFNSWLGDIMVFLIFGVGLSIVYLSIFNRKTRQSLHDLAVGSYVVNSGVGTVPLFVESPWRGHLIVVAILITIVAIAPIVTNHLANTEPFASLLALQKKLSGQPGIRYVPVVAAGAGFTANLQDGSRSSTNLSIQVVTDSKDINGEALANKIAQVALDSYADANKKDVVSVSISYGYDIGIASAWRTQNFAFSPALWRGRLRSTITQY